MSGETGIQLYRWTGRGMAKCSQLNGEWIHEDDHLADKAKAVARIAMLEDALDECRQRSRHCSNADFIAIYDLAVAALRAEPPKGEG